MGKQLIQIKNGGVLSTRRVFTNVKTLIGSRLTCTNGMVTWLSYKEVKKLTIRLHNTKDNKNNNNSLNYNKGDGFKMEHRFYKKATTKAINTGYIYKDNYRYELERFRGLTEFLVEARIDKFSSKHVDNMFGGYKIRTILLKDISIAIIDPKDNKLKRIGRVHHVWINAEENTIVRDKNNEINDIVRFIGCVGTYKYSHGGENLGLKQTKPWHKNRTQGYEYKR